MQTSVPVTTFSGAHGSNVWFDNVIGSHGSVRGHCDVELFSTVAIGVFVKELALQTRRSRLEITDCLGSVKDDIKADILQRSLIESLDCQIKKAAGILYRSSVLEVKLVFKGKPAQGHFSVGNVVNEVSGSGESDSSAIGHDGQAIIGDEGNLIYLRLSFTESNVFVFKINRLLSHGLLDRQND